MDKICFHANLIDYITRLDNYIYVRILKILNLKKFCVMYFKINFRKILLKFYLRTYKNYLSILQKEKWMI